MGLAPFFERARQSAAQVLNLVDPDAFKRQLSDVTVTLAFDTQAATSLEGLSALDLAARLVARLYPRVRILALDDDPALAEELAGLMLAINPNIEIVDRYEGREIALVAGVTPYAAHQTIYLGSDGWIGRVSTTSPCGSALSANPFGSGAAACIAVANLFRSVFAAWLPRPQLDDDLQVSLLNFATGPDAANADFPAGLDIGRVQLVGVGAIGNAFVWSLSRLRNMSGRLDLIDHETIDLSNFQRYVLPSMADEGDSKVALASDVLRDTGITVTGVSGTWAAYVAANEGCRFDLVAVALDTAKARVEVQASLPRRIVNSWTQAGDLGISRHGFEDENACLACLYLPTGPRRSEDEIVTEELGFPDNERLNVRAMLFLGTPVDQEMAHRIARQVGVPPETLQPFAGLPLRAFRQKAICGNAIMRAKDGGGADVEVPMAFQSAFAGIMLAAEVIISACEIDRPEVETRTVVDLMRKLPSRIGSPARKGTTGPARCICEDQDYVDAYKEKYQKL